MNTFRNLAGTINRHPRKTGRNPNRKRLLLKKTIRAGGPDLGDGPIGMNHHPGVAAFLIDSRAPAAQLVELVPGNAVHRVIEAGWFCGRET